jgi:glycerophosphoryl diester phosphodiesterase
VIDEKRVVHKVFIHAGHASGPASLFRIKRTRDTPEPAAILNSTFRQSMKKLRDTMYRGLRNLTLCLAVLSGLLVVDCRMTSAGDPILISHRGLLRHAPENTLPNFAACLELGIGFELDIRTTKDGQLVVIHDDNVERTTNGPSRSIRDMTLEEVKQLDAGRWFDPVFAGVRVPTLEETLSLVKNRKRGPTIVALNVKQLNPDGEAKLVTLVKKYGLLDESFAFDQNVEISRRLKKLNPKFRIGQNVNRKSLDARLREDFLDVFLLTFAPTREEVDRLHKHGKQVLYNYAGPGEARRSQAVWSQVREAGIDGMLTDYPLDCRALWRTSND